MTRGIRSRTGTRVTITLAAAVALVIAGCELNMVEYDDPEPGLGLRLEMMQTEIPPSELVAWVVPAEWVERAADGETDSGEPFDDDGEIPESFSDMIDPADLFPDEDWDEAVAAGEAAFEAVDLADEPSEGDTLAMNFDLPGGKYHVYAVGFHVDERVEELHVYAGASFLDREVAEEVFSDSGDSELTEGDLLSPIRIEEGGSHTATVEMAATDEVDLSVAYGDIVFVSDRDDDTAVFVVEADGSGMEKLFDIEGLDDEDVPPSPSLSPDGSRIAYAAENGDGGTGILVYSLETGDSELVTEGAAVAAPSWIGSETLLYYQSGDEVDDGDGYYAIELDEEEGTEEGTPIFDALDDEPRPATVTEIDGNAVIAAPAPGSEGFGAEIGVVNVGDSDPEPETLLTLDQAAEEVAFEPDRFGRPSWSPDGDRMVVSVAEQETETSDLLVIDVTDELDEDGIELLYESHEDTFVGWPTWSPDGNHIAFNGGEDVDAYDIFVIDAEGGEPVNLTNDPTSADALPDWGVIEVEDPRDDEEGEFRTLWNTENTTEDSSEDNQIALPLHEDGSYDFTVDWGDGSENDITSWDDEATVHTYDEPGEYEVVISGEIEGFSFYLPDEVEHHDAEKLLGIQEWGSVRLGNQGFHFNNAGNLQINATDIPDLTGTTFMRGTFAGAESLETVPKMNEWDVSSVEDTSSMFYGAESFDENIADWDLGSVWYTGFMFQEATSFDQDIGGWDVSSVTNMNSMFLGATSFDQDIGGWDVSSVTTIEWMFAETESFDQDIGEWDVSNVELADNMFFNASLSTENYDSLLIGWLDSERLQDDVDFDGGDSQYTADAEDARNALIDDFGWNITDGGKDDTGEEDFEDAADSMRMTVETEEEDEVFVLGFGGPDDEVNAEVDFGDGSDPVSITEPDEPIGHEYEDPSEYTGKIIGTFEGFGFPDAAGEADPGFDTPLKRVDHWGEDTGTVNMASAFAGQERLEAVPEPPSTVRDMSGAFELAENFNHDISDWDTSEVTNMAAMFRFADSFNQDISGWDTASVTDMSMMFESAGSFNQDIGGWDTGSVTDMSGMFNSAGSFNQDLNNWTTDNVTNMASMFTSASSFDGDISEWNTQSVTDMRGMFFGAEEFDQPIGDWKTGSVEQMALMFEDASSFNQDIGDWNTESVAGSSAPFSGMHRMFRDAEAFNQDISDWDTGAVENMAAMFEGATSFDQDIGGWDTGSVIDLSSMFEGATSFNQDIGNWDVEEAGSMRQMFKQAVAFDQDLGDWKPTNVGGTINVSGDDASLMFSGAKLSPEKYDSLLIGWGALADNDELIDGVDFDGGDSQYSLDAAGAREDLADVWNITDGGPAPE